MEKVSDKSTEGTRKTKSVEKLKENYSQSVKLVK